ncbi:carbohydrate-binding protein [Cohnella sp. CFH 77786]|uniref:glycoside hydrolase family 3 protein n=1 Tax=Cohnella sp. CFH 77786 TaxID=2662265 RepID=UPI001C60DF25|nr:glycoside hydrolase family 3 protein [Cohnella sp. CFH 77786]MBW5447176.1 carbohydrate-binding protein [Cohnella sp. CFH 77786]
MTDLDAALRNTFRVRFRLGEFDPAERNPYAEIDESAILRAEHAELAREAVQKAVVLLKNDVRTLPLQADKLSNVAVIGPLADIVYRDGYSGTLPYAITPLQGIRERMAVKTGAEMTCSFGTDLVRIKAVRSGQYVRLGDDEKNTLSADAARAEEGDVFEITDWGSGSHTLIAQRNGRYLTTDDKTLQASAHLIWGWFTKEVFQVKPVDPGSSLFTISTWNGMPVTVDEEMGKLLVGDGRAAETANEINVGGAAEIGGSGAGLQADTFEIERVLSGIDAAVEAARSADAAIVFVGNHPLINGKETMDRPDITLAESQEKLALAVIEANPNTIVVVVGSYPFALNALQEKAPAIVYTSHAGQELGRAVADVLFGDTNPAGRVNMTWYKSVDQLPPFMDYDIIRGGRTYQYFEGEPLYPFGHGLSYSEFRYEALHLSSDHVQAGTDTEVLVACRVTNISDRKGEEVVQLYVRAESSRVKRPRLQLADFQRIALASGESAEVTFRLQLDSLAIWDVTRDRFCVEGGAYTVMLGTSSCDLRLQGRLMVSGETIPPRDLTKVTRAANYDAYQCVHLGDCVEGGSAAVANGERGWLAFHDAELGTGISAIELRAAAVENAEVEVRLDGPDGPVAGKCKIPAGGEQEWRSLSFGLTGVSGRRDVYLILDGPVSLGWFRMMAG